MKSRILTLCGLLIIMVTSGFSVNSPGRALSSEEAALKERIEASEMDKKSPQEESRLARKKAGLEKRLHKWEQKAAKKRIKKTNNVWSNLKFKIGVILIGSALAVGLLGVITSWSFLSFLAGLFGLAGIIFLVWGLIEYSS